MPAPRQPNGRPDTKKKGAQPFEDSDIRRDDIERVHSAIADLLRTVGYLPRLPPLPGLAPDAPFEISTVCIAREGKNIVPMLVRMHSHKPPTVQLVPTSSWPHEPEMPLEHLPQALTEGRGRIRRRDDHAALADFLTQALALDSAADRLFLARAQLLRDTQIWPWHRGDLDNRALTPQGPGRAANSARSTRPSPGRLSRRTVIPSAPGPRRETTQRSPGRSGLREYGASTSARGRWTAGPRVAFRARRMVYCHPVRATATTTAPRGPPHHSVTDPRGEEPVRFAGEPVQGRHDGGGHSEEQCEACGV
ncbi:hypothetical protein ACH432_33400, partial [Streptomyces jumonjinensis]|uniref:hypothetical protein n=1 Tax=Streptomyces jumonjinensis TaxID=1945 RepID=UPI0037BB5B26